MYPTQRQGGEHLQEDEGSPGPVGCVRRRLRFRMRWGVRRQDLPPLPSSPLPVDKARDFGQSGVG